MSVALCTPRYLTALQLLEDGRSMWAVRIVPCVPERHEACLRGNNVGMACKIWGPGPTNHLAFVMPDKGARYIIPSTVVG